MLPGRRLAITKHRLHLTLHSSTSPDHQTLNQSPPFLSRLPDNHVSAVDDGSARQQTRCYKHGRAPLAAWVSHSKKATRLYRHAIHATEAFWKPTRIGLAHCIQHAQSHAPGPAQINKARHRVSSRSHMRRPHTDRFAKTAVRILRLSASPTHFLDNNFPLQSRPPVKVALLGNCFLVHLAHMLNQEAVLDPLASPVSLSSLSSLYFQLPLLYLTLLSSPCLTQHLQPQIGPFRLHRYLARNFGMSLVST